MSVSSFTWVVYSINLLMLMQMEKMMMKADSTIQEWRGMTRCGLKRIKSDYWSFKGNDVDLEIKMFAKISFLGCKNMVSGRVTSIDVILYLIKFKGEYCVHFPMQAVSLVRLIQIQLIYCTISRNNMHFFKEETHNCIGFLQIVWDRILHFFTVAF